MTGLRIIGLVLILGGAFALWQGSFSYTRDTTAVKLGPMELSLKEKKTVDIPLWAGAAAVIAGGLLVIFGKSRK